MLLLHKYMLSVLYSAILCYTPLPSIVRLIVRSSMTHSLAGGGRWASGVFPACIMRLITQAPDTGKVEQMAYQSNVRFKVCPACRDAKRRHKRDSMVFAIKSGRWVCQHPDCSYTEEQTRR